jgi:hypothetical protein
LFFGLSLLGSKYGQRTLGEPGGEPRCFSAAQ